MPPLGKENNSFKTVIAKTQIKDNMIGKEDKSIKLLEKKSVISKSQLNSKPKSADNEYRLQIVWSSVFKISLLHLIAFYGMYCTVAQAKYQTVIWAYFMAMSSAFGVLAGAHRLWSHKCYKARTPLRVLLMILETLALQNDIYEWSRDHRVHHKYAETDADPHNSNRGFFFAHMGWLMARKHPQVIEKGRQIDMSDIWSDPVVRFQRKYYTPLVILIWGIIPTLIPCFFWSETLLISFAINMTRYCVSLHQAWLVNSAAHMFGLRPYDRNIASAESFSVIYLSLGEGYHNYHHTFPYDYSASEYGWKTNFNLATAFIDFFALIGQAYDLKFATTDQIVKRRYRTGDDMKIPTKNTFVDYIYGSVISTWPLWLAFAFRAILI